MTGSMLRRLTAAPVAAAVAVMAWSACGGGTLWSASVICCAEHHADCAMADMADTCCRADRDADVEMLVPKRADDFASALDTLLVVVSLPSLTEALRAVAAPPLHAAPVDTRPRARPRLPVLLI